MEIPDIHVSNITLDTFLIENVNLLDIILDSLISQYVDENVDTVFPSGGIPASGPGSELGITNATPTIAQETVDGKKYITITSGGDDTLLISSSGVDGENAVTGVTFSVAQTTDSTHAEKSGELVLGAGIFIKKHPPSRVVMHRSVERAVQKVINRMNLKNESIYSAMASVMTDSAYAFDSTQLSTLLTKYYGYFVDLTKEADGTSSVWSFVYPVSSGDVTYKTIRLNEDIQKMDKDDVKIKLIFDYLARPGIFVITFTENKTGLSHTATIDLNEGGTHQDLTSVKFDEPGTSFLLINNKDVAVVSDSFRVIDPPDPTPTPSPTVTVTHPTPTPTVSPTVTITEPTPTPTVSPTITISPPFKDITLLYTLETTDDWTTVSLNTDRMSIVDGRNIAGFTIAFHVPDSYNYNTGDDKVKIMAPFDNFSYRYATTGGTYNILYITGYCTFRGTSQPVPTDSIPVDGVINIVQIKRSPSDADVVPVDPAHNKVVGFSNNNYTMWEINSSRSEELRSGFFITDMTGGTFVLNVDTNVTGATGDLLLHVEGIDINPDGIDKSGLGDDDGWDVGVATTDGIEKIHIKRKYDDVKLAANSVVKIKFKYSRVTSEIRIKKAQSESKDVVAQYLIPEDVSFSTNVGEARIRTKYLKDKTLKTFMVITKYDMRDVNLSAELKSKGWSLNYKYGDDGYTRVLANGPSHTFSENELLFTYTPTVHVFRAAVQQKNYGFVNALNKNVVTMASATTVGSGNDEMSGIERYSWVLNHIHDDTELPDEESLGQFYVKSDVTFDGRILVNDVVAMVQDLITDKKEYPSTRPLNTFNVKYTLPSTITINPGFGLGNVTVNIDDYINITQILSLVGPEISKPLYGVGQEEYVKILGSETSVGGETTIYARVHWKELGTLSSAIGGTGSMFGNISVSVDFGAYGSRSLSISPVDARPKGVLALVQLAGEADKYTVYAEGISKVSYWTNTNSTRTTVDLTGSRKQDFVVPKMLYLMTGGFDEPPDYVVVYAQGYDDYGNPVGGEANHIVVEPTVDDPPVPTWTHTTTFTPTPTATASTSPTPSPTITGSPPEGLVITDVSKPFGDTDITGMVGAPTYTIGCLLYLITGSSIALDGSQYLVVFYSDEMSRVVQYAQSSTTVIYTSILHRNTSQYTPAFKLFDQKTMTMYDVELHADTNGTTVDNTFKSFTFVGTKTVTTYMKLNNPISVTIKGPPVPTWTHTTTFTPTPTATASTSPTPSPTITGSPPEGLVITDVSKPFGDTDITGMVGAPTYTIGCLLYLITGSSIALDGSQYLVVFYSDEMSRVVQYAQSSTTVIYTSILHRNTSQYTPAFKLFDQKTMTMYDVELHADTNGTTVDNTFKSFTFVGTKTVTTYMKLNNPISVTVTGGSFVMVDKIIGSADNTQFELDSDDFHWVSFPKIVGEGRLVDQESNMIIPIGKLVEIIYYDDASSQIVAAARIPDGTWTKSDIIISPHKMYLLKCKNLIVKTAGDNKTEYASDLKKGWNWVGYPLTQEYINDLAMPDYTQVLSWNYTNKTADGMIKLPITGWATPGNAIWTFKPYHGYYIYVPEDTKISWPVAGPVSSGSSTFNLKEESTGIEFTSSGGGGNAKGLKLEINLETLNPMEFYAGSNLKYDGTYSVGAVNYNAVVDRRSDVDSSAPTVKILSEDAGSRYMKMRSIEVHVDKHVYLDLGKTDTVQTITYAAADEIGPPTSGEEAYKKMYVYCARGVDGDKKTTKIMIVNADVDVRKKLTDGNLKLELEKSIYVAAADAAAGINIDYVKSYIGTTSVFSRGYAPENYERRKQTVPDPPGRYPIHGWGFGLSDLSSVDGGSKGSYLRFSIDDGAKVHEGGVSTTDPDEVVSRKIYEYVEEGNVEGNVDFFSLT